MKLEWTERDGGRFLELAAQAPAGAGLYLAVRRALLAEAPHGA